MEVRQMFQEKLTQLLLVSLLMLVSETTTQRNIQRQTVHSYCRSFKNCHDCKKAAYQCDWCHDFGCTNHPRLHCPKKAFFDHVWRKNHNNRYCTEVTTKSPIFVAANVRQFLKFDLKIDDMTVYERNIVCEIHVDSRIIQVPGTLDENTVYCESTVLKQNKGVALGQMRLIWGGAEPYSNTVLLMVYNCRSLAQSCRDCQNLNKEFKCGWCRDTLSCSLREECSRRYGPWVDRNFTCFRESRAVSPFTRAKNIWFNWNEQ